MKQIIMFFVLCLLTQNALSDYYSGEDLLKQCESDQYLFCIGYAVGTHDAVFLEMENGGSFNNIRFCTRKGISTGQIKRVVNKYLNDHPELLHYGASSLVLFALQEAFPCE